jgi:hypothetical protein
MYGLYFVENMVPKLQLILEKNETKHTLSRLNSNQCFDIMDGGRARWQFSMIIKKLYTGKYDLINHTSLQYDESRHDQRIVVSNLFSIFSRIN